MAATTSDIPNFLTKLAAATQDPGPVVLDSVLQPCIEAETTLRTLWAKDRSHTLLQDPYVGLVDVFGSDTPPEVRTTKARVVQDEEDLSAKYIFPLSPEARRKDGTPSMSGDYEEFKKNWLIFTEGSLSQLFDWDNVVAAGGSVLACLLPLSDKQKESKRAIRKYYHSEGYPTSDVDLFLWGMNAEQAEKKIMYIYEAVRDSVPWDVTCVRTKHSISIHSQYPYRSIQIVLRLYQSPAEILAGFDIDAPCVAYDGKRVWANPRAIVSMMRQCNTVDMTRRSPSYEVRLTKYSSRGFEIYVPTLKRDEVDPTIYERSIARIEGLARLLVLEKLITSNVRDDFLEARRNLRGRPNPLSRYRKRRRGHKGDLKANIGNIGGLEMNDYDVASLHIPYGPGWDSRRIEKLVYGTDLGMNSTFNPKNKGRRLHRHPAFFGTMEECLEDCCECCPGPIDEDERDLQKKEDEQYIRGRIAFIEQDPGRQTMTGSFNPIDVGEWSDQTYISPSAKLFTAISQHDRPTVLSIINSEFDATRRDHVGRTPLHLAILCGAESIACDLIDAGVRVTARLVDGKAAVHLAAQMDQVVVVKKLLERSRENEKKSKSVVGDAEGGEETPVQPPLSSADDWSSHDSDDIDIVGEDEADDEDDGDDENEDEDDDDSDDGKQKTGKNDEKGQDPAESGELPEDEDEQPDIIDINMADWDLAFTPLFYAVVYASLPLISTLLEAGADPKLVSQASGYNVPAFHPLSLVIIRKDQSSAIEVAERLITAGASASEADSSMRTIFHHAVSHGHHDLVKTFLRLDKNSETLLNFPLVNNRNIVSPVVTTIACRQWSMLALLLANGAQMELSTEDASKAVEKSRAQSSAGRYYYSTDVKEQIYKPLEVSIASSDEIFQLLLALGADVNTLVRSSEGYVKSSHNTTFLQTLLDCTRNARRAVQKQIREAEKADASSSDSAKEEEEEEEFTGWMKFAKQRLANPWKDDSSDSGKTPQQEKQEREQRRRNRDTLDYTLQVEKLLIAQGAKTWAQLKKDEGENVYEDDDDDDKPPPVKWEDDKKKKKVHFTFYPITYYWSRETVPDHTKPLYDQLFNAALAGDNDKIEELCLPKEKTPASQSILQVSVEAKEGDNNNNASTGITPFSLAVLSGHWDTARLILAIAAAQYKKPDDQPFSTSALYLDEDDDEDDDCSTCSDDTVEQDRPLKPTSFKDISQRASAVQCSCSPASLLTNQHVYYVKKKTEAGAVRRSTSLLQRSIETADLQLFTRLADLYLSVSAKLDADGLTLSCIIQEDLPNFLDECIRRTGRGIHIEAPKEGEDDIPQVINDENKLYLGLKVHGKKRADLAQKNDPNAAYESSDTQDRSPLVWRAASNGALKIVEYLHTARPAEAYQFYAKTKGDEKALRLRKVERELPKILPAWLGWTITPLRESPLTAAVMSGKLDAIKKLFAVDPKLMKEALHEKIKFSGLNLMNVAAASSAGPDVFDFLLAKHVSPVEIIPATGYNILHHLAGRGADRNELLEHVLKKLPRDTIEALMVQQSKNYNTPLHLAVKSGNIFSVTILLPFTPSKVFLMRDALGNAVLHIAIGHNKMYPKITQLLLSHPSAPTSEMLYMENGLGETPIDTLTLSHLLHITRQVYSKSLGDSPPELRFSYNQREPNALRLAPPFDPTRLDHLKKQLPVLKQTLAQLTESGKIKKGSKSLTEWLSWLSMMEARSSARAQELAADEVAESKKDLTNRVAEREARDSSDADATFECVREAVERDNSTSMVVDSSPVKPGLVRNLVHLADVQLAIKELLKKSSDDVKQREDENKRRKDENDDALAAEDANEEEKKDAWTQHLSSGQEDIL